MKTDLTIKGRDEGVRGWVLYDGDCPLCIRAALRFEPLLLRKHLHIAPLQTPWVVEKLGLNPAERFAEMHFLTSEDRDFGGADAVVEIAKRIWWARPLVVFSKLPGGMRLLRAGYRFIATRRTCANGVCELPRRTDRMAWVPLMILPLVALSLRPILNDWAFMWTMAFALYGGCKWLTLRKAFRGHTKHNAGRALAYLFLWPGMDAKAFLDENIITTRPTFAEWWWTGTKILFGAVLVYAAVYGLPLENPLLRGWIGMVGLVLLLHFGLFELLAWVWRTLGVNAVPIMRTPLAATSLAEFWGKRWNVAFNLLVNNYTFRPLARRVGMVKATLLAFLLSGLIHELVITLPARGGYGGPTLFFLIQGVGLLVERTGVGHRLGLGGGLRGWCFTMGCLIIPMATLFPAPFVTRIILPFLETATLK